MYSTDGVAGFIIRILRNKAYLANLDTIACRLRLPKIHILSCYSLYLVATTGVGAIKFQILQWCWNPLTKTRSPRPSALVPTLEIGLLSTRPCAWSRWRMDSWWRLGSHGKRHHEQHQDSWNHEISVSKTILEISWFQLSWLFPLMKCLNVTR